MSWSGSTESYIPMFDISGERMRGVGILSAMRNSNRVILPLADIRISASVAGQVASVIMTQKFQNPYSEHLEATYTFPLPGGAAVSDFEMRVGNRVIKGRVEERGEARRQYQQAINEGKRAAIMEKERDDVFTVQVGNLPPGEEISIRIVYSEFLPFFEDGTTEMRLPLVVSPRYIPGHSLWRDPVGDGVEQDTNLVPDASRISPPRLAKSFEPAVSLSIDIVVLWDTKYDGGEIRNLTCSQHAIRTAAGYDGVKISLARHNEALDRDFVLRWTVSSDKLRTSMLMYRDGYGDNYASLSIIPPYSQGRYPQARDIVFVLDRSGSMQGMKMGSASRACALLLNTLTPHDRFAIQSFSSNVDWLTPYYYYHGTDGYFLPADYYGVEQGQRYLRNVNSGGGTEMHRALSVAMTALEQRRDSYRRVPVIVLLTDGEVGNESHILKEVQQRLGQARLFTVGIDTAVNEGFLKRLASVGSGTATFVTPGSQLEDALVTVGREIGSPVVVNLRIEDIDGGLEPSTIAPNKIPDLFAARASNVTFVTHSRGRVRVKGRYVDGGEFSVVVEPREVAMPAIGQLWAKSRISDLEDRYRIELSAQERIKREIITLSTRFNVLTKFTAFIAVDHNEIVNWNGHQRHVVQPVENPANWQKEKEMQLRASGLCSMEPNLTENYASRPSPSIPMDSPITNQGGFAPTTPPRVPSSFNNVAPKAPKPSYMAPELEQKAPSVNPRKREYSRPDQEANTTISGSAGIFGHLIDAVKGIVGSETSVNKSAAVPPSTVVPSITPPSPGNIPINPPNITSTSYNGQVYNERAIIERAITALQDAYSGVYSGRLASVTHLDLVRQQIIDLLLRNSALRQSLQRLFRFYDVEIHDLINSLNRNNPRPVFDQHRHSFECVVEEVRVYFNGGVVSPSRKDASFWDSGI